MGLHSSKIQRSWNTKTEDYSRWKATKEQDKSWGLALDHLPRCLVPTQYHLPPEKKKRWWNSYMQFTIMNCIQVKSAMRATAETINEKTKCCAMANSLSLPGAWDSMGGTSLAQWTSPGSRRGVACGTCLLFEHSPEETITQKELVPSMASPILTFFQNRKLKKHLVLWS
jgi:hypothetical protein